LEMKKKGHMLDIFAYNMLLDALVKDCEVWFLWIYFCGFFFVLKKRNNAITNIEKLNR
jgi:hypothetical protein